MAIDMKANAVLAEARKLVKKKRQRRQKKAKSVKEKKMVEMWPEGATLDDGDGWVRCPCCGASWMP